MTVLLSAPAIARVERIPFSTAQTEAQAAKEHDPEDHPRENLHQRSERDRAPGAEDLLQVDLETDHEKQQDEAEFRDRVDALRRFNKFESHRPQHEAAREIGEQDRLAEEMRHQAQQPGRRDAQCDVPD